MYLRPRQCHVCVFKERKAEQERNCLSVVHTMVFIFQKSSFSELKFNKRTTFWEEFSIKSKGWSVDKQHIFKVLTGFCFFFIQTYLHDHLLLSLMSKCWKRISTPECRQCPWQHSLLTLYLVSTRMALEGRGTCAPVRKSLCHARTIHRCWANASTCTYNTEE